MKYELVEIFDHGQLLFRTTNTKLTDLIEKFSDAGATIYADELADYIETLTTSKELAALLRLTTLISTSTTYEIKRIKVLNQVSTFCIETAE